MKFEVPCVITEAPTKAYWKKQYPGEGMKAKLAFLSAKKVYMRVQLAEAQNWRCCWCGTRCVPESNKHNSATIEHVTPKCQGGTDTWENFAMACNRCNQARGVRSVDRFLELVQKGNVKQHSKADHRAAKAAASKAVQATVRNAVAASDTNPFDYGTKEHKMFERYKASDSLSLNRMAA